MGASVNKIQHSMKITVKGNPAPALFGIKQFNLPKAQLQAPSRETQGVLSPLIAI